MDHELREGSPFARAAMEPVAKSADADPAPASAPTDE